MKSWQKTFSLARQCRASKCRIPDDCIYSKRYPLFMARAVLQELIESLQKREVFVDRSHTAHRLQTVLTPAQQTVVVHLRRTLLLPLDDLLAVTREFLSPDVSRSGLDRCLRRHGVGNLNALKPREPTVAHKAFKSYEPGLPCTWM